MRPRLAMPARIYLSGLVFLLGVAALAVLFFFSGSRTPANTAISSSVSLAESSGIAPTKDVSRTTLSLASAALSPTPAHISDAEAVAQWREQSGMNVLDEAAYIYTQSAGMSDSIRSEYASYSVAQLMRMADGGDGKAALLIGLNDALTPEQQQQYLERSLLTSNYTLAAFQIAMSHENTQLQTHAPLMLRLEQNDNTLTASDRNYLVWLSTAAALNDVFSQNLLAQRLLPHLAEADIAAIRASAEDNLRRLNAQR